MHIHPSQFINYRAVHEFRGPCCLCASDGGDSYTESAVYLALSGQYDGEYVAGCASDRCGYFGTWPSTPRQATVLTLKPVLYLVDMERMYTRRGLLTEQYPVRSKSIFDAIFVIITHLPLALQMLNIRLRRQYPLCQLLGGRMVS